MNYNVISLCDRDEFLAKTQRCGKKEHLNGSSTTTKTGKIKLIDDKTDCFNFLFFNNFT